MLTSYAETCVQSHTTDKLCPILFNTQVVQEVKDGCVCDSCGWPVCNQECAAGPNHQIECKVRVRHMYAKTKTKIKTKTKTKTYADKDKNSDRSVPRGLTIRLSAKNKE